MKHVTAGLLAAATLAIAVPLAAKAYADHQVYQIDAAPGTPPTDQLLRPSYVDGFSHGQIAIAKQYSRIYPTAEFDLSRAPALNWRKGSIAVKTNARFPQVILSQSECITRQKLGRRQGQRCVPY